MSARVWVPGRSVSGRTQRSAPAPRRETASKSGRTGGDGAPPQPVKRRADAPKAWLPPTKFRSEIWGVSHRHRPLRKNGGYGAASPLGITAVRPSARSEAPAPIPRPAAAAALPPAMPLRGKPDSRHFQKKQAADRGPPSFVPRRAAKRPRPSSVPPPQRPFRRQCRSAASRTAGTINRSRHPTGDPVPRPRRAAKRLRLSREKSRKGPKAPSWFPPPAERIRIIFRRGVYVTKNPSHEVTCKKGPTPVGSDPFCAKAQCNAPSGIAGGGIGHRAAQGRHGAGGV